MNLTHHGLLKFELPVTWLLQLLFSAHPNGVLKFNHFFSNLFAISIFYLNWFLEISLSFGIFEVFCNTPIVCEKTFLPSNVYVNIYSYIYR